MRLPTLETLAFIGAWSAFHLAVPAVAVAQEAGAGIDVQSYSMLDSESVGLHHVQLVTAPIRGHATLASWANLSVRGGLANASVRLPDGQTESMTGVTDTRVALELRKGGFLLRGLGLLPTGEVVGSLEEAAVVGLLSSDLLPFERTHWGTGGQIGGDLGYAFRIARTRVALSMGHVETRASAPLEENYSGHLDPPRYRPGSQTRVRAAVDADVREADVLSLVVGFQAYETDTYEERNLFSPGDRLESTISYTFPFGARESALVFGGFDRRNAGSLVWMPVGFQRDPDRGDLFPGATPSTSRLLLRGGSELRISRGHLDMLPRAEMRILRSGEGLGQGWLASAGGRVEYRVAGGRLESRFLLQPSAVIRFGRVVADADARSGVFGWQLGMTARWTSGR